MDKELKNQKILLAVLAHPDDESFGAGGTLAYYSRQGVEVFLICGTRGEVGTVDPALLQGFNSISELREAELRCAGSILGLAGVYFLGYRDSGMQGSLDNTHPQALAVADTKVVAKQIAHLIRQLQPQVVLTFDPLGGYMHPDHIAIQRATLEAFSLAGDPDHPGELLPFQPAKLYYQTFPRGYLRWAVRILRLFGRDPRRFGRNHDLDLEELANAGDFPVHAVIDVRPVESVKAAAAACHTSQLESGPPQKGIMRWVVRRWNRKETYMRAIPAAESGLRENDLFTGID